MLKTLLENLIESTCQELGYTYPDSVVITEPPVHIPGDYSVNIALQLSRELQKPPREIAETIAEKLRGHEDIKDVELAGPGFLNIRLSDQTYQKALIHLSEEAKTSLFNRVLLPPAERKPVSVEFVSANPSGPLHIGNARGGPLGEAISRLLEAQGHTITREFYVNDVGGQANRFGASVLHFYAAELGQEKPFPEDGYKAEYVKELAHNIIEENGDSILRLPEHEQVDAIRQLAIARMVEGVKKITARMGINFDRWFWQSSLHQDGKLVATIYRLKQNGATLEKDGATWIKSGITDDDRESVLVKSDGTTGYFLDDIAYHIDKLEDRGNAWAVCLLGADHSGHPPRMRAGLQGAGISPDRYQAVVYQYVQLKVDGEAVGMAKREGKFVTAEQVLNEVPRDVFTYFMVSKAHETHVDFDLQLAKDTSEKNPVYSIQYAHARIHSLLNRAAGEGFTPHLFDDMVLNDSEQALVRQLADFADTVTEAAESYRVNLITQYLTELSARYHYFYSQNRVVQADHVTSTRYRLMLSFITQKVLAEGLRLVNISAPEQLSRD